MKDQIMLVESDEEAFNLGWTCLRGVPDDNCYEGIGWIWCKSGVFVVLTGEPNGFCTFKHFIEKKEAFNQMEALNLELESR